MIVAGIRVAAVTTVGLVTVTFIVGYGGLGFFIRRGLARDFPTEILLGRAIGAAGAVLVDLALVAAERALTPWAQPKAARTDLSRRWQPGWATANWTGERGLIVRTLEHIWISVLSVTIAVILMVPWRSSSPTIGRGLITGSLVNLGSHTSFGLVALAYTVSLSIGLGFGFWPTLVALVALAMPPIFTNAHRSGSSGLGDSRGGAGPACRRDRCSSGWRCRLPCR